MKRAALAASPALLGVLVSCVVGPPAPPEPPPVVEGDSGAWELIAPLSSPRQEHAVVALGGEVVILGGFDDVTTVNAVEAYAPSANSWRSLAPLPLPLHHPNAAVAIVDGAERLIVAGFLVGAEFRADRRVLILDGDSWREGLSHPEGEGRGASAVCAIDDAVYVFGGSANGSRSEASRYLAASDTWEALPDLPRRLDHVLCVAHDGALWIVSGRENGLRNHTAALLRFDPVAETYETKASMPTSRAGAAAAVVDDALYVVGGEGNPDDPSGVYDAAERYDFATDTWTSIIAMRTPRHGMGAAGVDGVLYVPGGAPVQAFGAIDVNERFVPVSSP